MDITMDDRSIKIPVELDDKQAQKELNRLEASIRKAQDALDKKGIKKDGITAQLEEATKKATALQEKLNEINAAKERAGARRSKLSDDITDAQAASDNAKSRVERLNTEIETARNNAKRAARELGMMEELSAKDPYKTSDGKARTATGTDAILDARNGLEAQRQKVSELNAEYERLVMTQESHRQTIQIATAEADRLKAELSTVPTDESFAAPIKETEAALKEATAEVKKRSNEEANINRQILDEEANIRRLTGQYNTVNAQIQQQGVQAWPQVKAAAANAMSGVSGSLRQGLKTMLKYGLGIRSMFILFRRLRSAIIDGIKQFANYDAETRNSINGLKSALATLKGSWAAAFAPIFNAVAPAIEYLINLLTAAANAVGTFLAVLGGKTTFKKAVSGLNDVGSAAAGAGAAAKEAVKQFSGLDELNVWQEDKGSGGGGGGGGGGGSGLEWTEEAIDPNSAAAKVAEFVRANLESVSLLVDEFGFVLGVILLASGHPLLGIGMMLFFGWRGIKEVSENWGAIRGQLQDTMGALFAIVNGALLTIGLILALNGHIPLGIALMAVGAAGLVTVAAANWGSLKEKLGGVVGELMTIASGAALALGIILASTGHLPLGIALIAAGAAGLASTVALNWTALQEALQGQVGKITAIASGALLALGVILAFTGNIPLGLGLIAAGAAGLAATVTANWDSIRQKIQPAIDVISGIASGALLALGIILALSGVGLPLGIALIKAGASGLANAAQTPTWTSIGASINTALSSVSDKYNAWAAEHPIAAAILNHFFGFAKAAVNAVSTVIDASVSLVQDGWSTVSGWVKDPSRFGADVSKAVSLLRNGWDTVWSWIYNNFMGGIISKAVNIFRNNFYTVWSWIYYNFMGGIVYKAVNIFRNNFYTVWSWIYYNFLGGIVYKAVNIFRNNFYTVWSWIYYNFMGGIISKAVNLFRNNFYTVGSWIYYNFLGGIVYKAVNIFRNNFDTVWSWIYYNFLGGDVWEAVALWRGKLWTTVDEWVSQFVNGAVPVTVTLVKGWIGSIKNWLGLSSGGTVSASGAFKLFACGGVITNNAMKSWGIPMYAGGTSKAHGTLFAAGEAGPEIVGHIGGRTEVLNRSQLASVMYYAIINGMASSLAGLRSAISSIGVVVGRVGGAVDRLVELVSAQNVTLAAPAMAQGTVIPPQILSATTDLSSIRSALDRLTASLDNGGRGGDYRFTAELNRRVLFDEVIDEARLRQAQTGNNPFNF